VLMLHNRWTNFDDVNGRRISVPKTAHVTEKKETNIPMKALDAIKGTLPDHETNDVKPLAPAGIAIPPPTD
jgi:sarcosine oxidase/L-pipecolate oxidase